jgi:sn-glycerol 3-phosphate transport system substrate-binding protein
VSSPRMFVALAGALALVVASACDDASRSEGRPGPTAPAGCGLEALAGEVAGVEITLWHSLAGVPGGTTSAAFSDLVDRFNRSQQMVRVKVKAFGSSEELVRRYYAIEAGGKGAPDVVQLPSPGARAAIDTERAVPVQSCLDAVGTDVSDFLPSTLAATRSEGTQWGLPVGFGANLLLYDTEAFVRAGLDPDRPPASLAELRAAADRLRVAGVARPLAKLDVSDLLATAGVQLADADNGHDGPARRATFETEEAKKVVGWARSLVDDGLVIRTDSKGNVLDDLLAVGRGEAVMTVHRSLDLKDVSRALAEGQAPGFRLGIASVPTLDGSPRTHFTETSFHLSNGTSLSRRAAGWKFLEWFASAGQQAQWHLSTGYFPTRRSAVSDPAVASLWAHQPELAAGWAAMTSGSWSTPSFIGPQGRLRLDLADALQDVFTGRASPEAALARAAAKGNQHLADYDKNPGGYLRWLTEPE